MKANLVVTALAGILFVDAGTSLILAADIQPAADAPQPHPPDESLKMFEVEPGFRVELVAAEPHLADPVAITFDAAGNIFACELHGYNLEGYFDIVELNKTGKLDKVVRRIPAPKWAIEKARKLQTGTVKKLVDLDGDGRVDRSSVFADKLPSCYGLVAARGGIVVLCAPDIYYLADHDGDGRAEVRRRIFTGFNEGEQWSRTNNLIWAEDNWVYACGGRGAAKSISGPQLPEPVRLGSSGYRFKADGSALEPITGSAGGFGFGMSDWGDRFLIHNSTNGLQIVPIPYRYQARNPHAPSPGAFHRAATYSTLYPASRPHPWRAERGRHKAWRDFYGHGEAKPNGRFTAACSPTFYRGGTFPPEYHGNLFACDSQQNLVNRAVPIRDGAKIHLRRPEGFENREFLASREGWFRPVNLANGPDGALYVVDMYREIIEDYSAIPRYLQQQYGLEKGADRGRIWRVVYEGAPKAKRLNLRNATHAELVEAIAHPNSVWRQTAQRLLVERGARQPLADATVSVLEKTVQAGATPQARLHALYTLDGLGALKPKVVERALDDAHFSVRWHALRLADRRLDANASLLRKTVGLVDDPDATVRLQLALTLGETQDKLAVAALAELAARHLKDTWMRPAIMSSVGRTGERLLLSVLENARDRGPSDLMGPLCEMVGARQDDKATARLLTAIAAVRGTKRTDVQRTCLEHLLRALGGVDAKNGASEVRDALRRLLRADSSAVNLLTYRIAVRLGSEDLPEVQRMLDTAGRRALDSRRELAERRAAITLLSGVSFARLEPVARKLLDPRQPAEIQLETVRAVATTNDPGAASLFLSRWQGYSPEVQEAVLDAIFARENRLSELLQAVEDGVVAAHSLSALRRVQLLDSPDPMVKDRASKVLVNDARNQDLEPLLIRYQAALAGPADKLRGKEVFSKNCAGCHRVEDEGRDVAPPLASAIGRPDVALLNEILDPSASIAPGYQAYTAVTADGRIFTGILASESATSITLRREKHDEDVILRKDIRRLVASGKSLMPDGLHQSIDPKAMADLIRYLRSVFGPARPSDVTLFDEDEAFLKQLNRGGGTAAIRTDDHFRGQACLSITPPQRYSASIPGWSYRIVKRPGPGEYRYLRLAWKCPKGKGAMVELAASGRWPDSKSPVRRYYSGENTTKWQATQVALSAPREWVRVTVDLWKDCGEFTLTGIAPTAMGGEVLFDSIELLQRVGDAGE